jgi:hypothetical protein
VAAVSETRVVRVDTHRVVMVLYGLCGSARAGLAFEPHPEDAGAVIANFPGRNGGSGQVAIPDRPELRATLDWLAANPKAEVFLRVVLAAVRKVDGVKGAWAYERALELLWGPRKKDESRAPKLEPVRRVVELLREAAWMLHGPVSAAPAPAAGKRSNRDRERDRKRSGYGGTFTGCLLSMDSTSRTVRLNTDLRQLLDAGPYDMRPVDVFALAKEGHSNPRGTKPSRACCWLMVHGAWDFARHRQQQALQRGGVVQAVAVEDLLGRWTSVDVEALHRRRLMGAVVDRLQVDLGGTGEVRLPAPIERLRQPGRCELRLQISLDRLPHAARQASSARKPRRGIRGQSRRPPVGATSSGTASSTGPPP